MKKLLLVLISLAFVFCGSASFAKIKTVQRPVVKRLRLTQRSSKTAMKYGQKAAALAMATDKDKNIPEKYWATVNEIDVDALEIPALDENVEVFVRQSDLNPDIDLDLFDSTQKTLGKAVEDRWDLQIALIPTDWGYENAGATDKPIKINGEPYVRVGAMDAGKTAYLVQQASSTGNTPSSS